MAYPKLAAMNIIHRFYPLDEFLSSSEAAGYEFVELWTGPMHFLLDHTGYEPLERLKAGLRAHGLTLVGLCPEQNNPKPHNIAARDTMRQMRTHASFCHAIEAAAQLGAPQVVVTPGWAFLDEPREAAWTRSVEMLSSLAEHAAQRGVRLVLEALQPEESVLVNTSAQLARLLDEVASPALLACLDTGAMERAGETINEYFFELGDRIVHCHFTDYGEVSHLAWGDGHRSMADDLAALVAHGYAGVCSVETYSERYLNDPAQIDARTMNLYASLIEKR